MGSIVIELPNLSETEEFEVKMLVAGGLYEKGRLSAGQAATVVGISKRAFLESLGKFGFSVFGYTEVELEQDLKTLEAWRKS